jgi:DNA-binding NtrC family response regulator
MSRLMEHRWPGNVRELENEIMRALVLGRGVIDEDLVLAEGRDRPASGIDPDGSLDMRAHMERLERSLIRAALDRTGGNQSAAARVLGISRYGLIKKMKRLGI